MSHAAHHLSELAGAGAGVSGFSSSSSSAERNGYATADRDGGGLAESSGQGRAHSPSITRDPMSDEDHDQYIPPPPSYDAAEYIGVDPAGPPRASYYPETSVSPPVHTQSYQAYAPPLPSASTRSSAQEESPYDGYFAGGVGSRQDRPLDRGVSSSSSSRPYAQGHGAQYSRGSEEHGRPTGTDQLNGMFSNLSVGGGGYTSSPVGTIQSDGGYFTSGSNGIERAPSATLGRTRQRTFDSSPGSRHPSQNGPHGGENETGGGGTRTPYEPTISSTASLNRHDTSSSSGAGSGYPYAYARGAESDQNVSRRPSSGSGSNLGLAAGPRDRDSKGSLRSLQGMTQYRYGADSPPPPVPALPYGVGDTYGQSSAAGSNELYGGEHAESSPYGNPVSSASSYALSMGSGAGMSSAASSKSGHVHAPGGPPTGRVVRNASSASSLSLSRRPTTNIGSSNTRRQGVKRAIDVNKPPFTKEFVDDYRARMKGDPDPEAQFAFAKYMIEAARIVGDDMGKTDPKAGRRYRDSLLSESLKLIKKIAEPSKGNDGHAEAQFFLANMIGTGQLGLQVEYERSYQLYMQASKQNHPAATYRTAVCNELGAGTRKEPNRAVLFYRKAATLRDTAAMYKLGMILLGGLLAQPKNQREGVLWLRRAAQQADEDNPHSLHELGMLYENPVLLGGANNPILPLDHAMARDCYTQAAQLGYAPSQFKLGTCYEYGTLGCQVDPKRSIAWLSRAAEKGESEAELALSGWFLTGAEGILKQSDEEAYLWARKAANKGLPKGEFAVAYYTEVGIGVKKDLALAQRWYMRAAAQGNDAAAKRLLELRGNKGGAGRRAAPSRKSKKDDESDCVVM